jgi:membrane-associated phospholipid phosphatase
MSRQRRTSRAARSRFFAIAGALVAFVATSARAQERTRIVVHRQDSLAWTAAMAGAWLGSEAMKGTLAPHDCRVCGTNALDDAIRDGLRWNDTELAARSSDVLGFVVVPLVGLGSLYATRDTDSEFVDDLLVVGEATMAAGVVVQGTKFLVGRQRPFVHALLASSAGAARSASDDNLSFYSGHTSVTLALGTSVAMLASLRGHRSAPWLWLTGLGAGLATGYLRVGADRHYATDVLTGAVLGVGIGAAIPLLHVSGEGAQRAGPTIGASASAFTLTWRL